MGIATFQLFKRLKDIPSECIVLDPTQITDLQRVILSIADDIVYVCNKYNILYFMGGGTALGAVRHKGFIPWDDDIDLNMTRSEYMRFMPRMMEEFPDKYWVHTPEDTHDYALLFGRIRLKNTVTRTRDDFSTDECGAFVDIFIVENTFDNYGLRMLHGALCTVSGLLLSCRKFYRDRKPLLAFSKASKKARAIFTAKIMVGFFLSFLSVDTMTHLGNACTALCHNDTSKWVCIPAGRGRFWKELYPRETFTKVFKAPFETREWNQSTAVDMYLEKLYGNYMAIPPEDERESHLYWEFSL